MYKAHKIFTKPDDENIKVWRFMDFTKFVSLLDTQSLYFARADEFSDPFAGSYSQANQLLRPVIYKEIPEHILSTLSATLAQWRRHVAINCWHLNEYESAAMWSLYIKGDRGVAVQSTFKSLTESFGAYPDEDIYVGKVKYIDYKKDWMPEGNLFYPFLHKRKSFEHERELRALLGRLPVKDDKLDLSLETIQKGISVPVKLEVLVHAVYVSPASEMWFYKLVQSILKKFGLEKSVLQSSISEDSPVF
jgi:hypothetical protein